MTKETLLNRQFTEREVTRMRNLLTKKGGDKTQIGVGYENNIKRNEGDIWEENGKTWTISNGIKKSIPKLSKFKQESIMPLTCPSCNEAMNRESEYVKQIYKLMKHCPKCQSKYETKLRLEGKFDDYAKEMYAKNHLNMVDDAEKGFEDFLEHGFEKYMSELGEVEDWSGKGMSDEKIKEVKEYFKNQRDKINTYLSQNNTK